MAYKKKETAKRRPPTRKSKRRYSKPARHLVPEILTITGLTTPLWKGNTGQNMSSSADIPSGNSPIQIGYDYVKYGNVIANDSGNGAQDVIEAGINAVKSNLTNKDTYILAGGQLVGAWGLKKLGKHFNVKLSKKWKVF